MSAIELGLGDEGHWVWDDNITGIAFVSDSTTSVRSTTAAATGTAAGTAAGAQSKSRLIKEHTQGTLYSDLCLSFTETPRAHDLVRFRRHGQRRTVAPQDIVTLRDIKDVLIFQVKQRLSAFFLDFFHMPEVDHFLRCLILYFHHYLQTWEWMTERDEKHANKIRGKGLRQSELTERANLATLRVLVARAYKDILLGLGATKRFHHTTGTQSSWSQRDVRMWEFLLRMSGRVVWIALQRRYLNLIRAEMDRLFRSEKYSLGSSSKDPEKRKQNALHAAVLQSVAGSRAAKMAPFAIGDECPPERGKKTFAFHVNSPLIHEIVHGDHTWRFLGLGRVPMDEVDDDDALSEMIQFLTKTEERLAADGHVIGILGLPRSQLDTMLNFGGKRAPESRSLAELLQNATAATRDVAAYGKEVAASQSKCISDFPRVRMSLIDDDVIEDLEIARSNWSKNYYKVR